MATDLMAGTERQLAAPGDRPAAPPEGRPRRRLAWLLALVAPALIGVVRAGWLQEGDPFWQVLTGQEILSRHTPFLAEDFSWTIPGSPWHPNSWLWDVLLAVVWHGAGRLGIGLLTAAAVLGVGVAVAAGARQLGARPGPTAVVVALLLAPQVPWLGARPQTASFALLALALLLTGRAGEQRGRRLAGTLLLVYLLTALWVNLHLVALGVVPVLGAGIAAALLTDRAGARRRLPRYVGVLVAALLGCISSPFGPAAVASAMATRNASTDLILEWAPIWRTSTPALVSWVGAAIAVAFAVAAWRRSGRQPGHALWVAAAVTLLVMGVDAVRFAPMAVVAALPAVAAWAGAAAVPAGRSWWSGRRLALRGAQAWCITLLLFAVVRLPAWGEPDPSSFPGPALIRAIPAHARVLAEYDDGGPILLARWADGVRIAADGRNDVFGVDLLLHLQGLVSGQPGAVAELTADRVDALELLPSRPLVQQALAAGWHVAARDEQRVLVLPPPAPSR